jgi:hypothetical protein
MWDNKNGKFPWKPGTPIAKCKKNKETGCDGVFWADSPQVQALAGNNVETAKPPTTTYAKPAQATFTPKAQVPVDKDVERYYEILTSVLLHHAKFVAEAPLAGEQAVEIASTATFSDLRTIATTISIARGEGGR